MPDIATVGGWLFSGACGSLCAAMYQRRSAQRDKKAQAETDVYTRIMDEFERYRDEVIVLRAQVEHCEQKHRECEDAMHANKEIIRDLTARVALLERETQKGAEEP